MDSLYNGGTEKSLLDMTSRFRTIEPIFCCFYEHRQLAEEFADAGIRVHFLGMSEAYGFRRGARYLHAVLEEEHPSLVVSHLLRSELITRWVCHRAAVPVVGTFVNDPYSQAASAVQSQSRRFKANVFQMADRFTARWCSHFIANSAAIAQSNARALHIPEQRVAVLPRGRNESIYQPPQTPRTGPIRTILNVARLLERKGQRELVQAFARVAHLDPTLRLHIAGEGVFRPHLESEIQRLGLTDRIVLLGNVQDIPGLLRSADVFVLPSHFEGFSGALVEAMLTGLPIVASAIPMSLEAVTDRVTARTFEPKDVSGLAAQLQWCIEHPDDARALGRTARTDALARFTLSAVTKRFESLLLDLIDRNAALAA